MPLPDRTLAVHWSRLGPYHLARLQAASDTLRAQMIRVVALETASRDEVYDWKEETGPTSFQRHVVFPGRSCGGLSRLELWTRFHRLLAAVEPAVMAINGYSGTDAQVLLSWCKLHGCPAILMSDSKADDAPRVRWREFGKRLIVRCFSAALCAGTPQRAYLHGLGMATEKISTGYDAVDNDYFEHGAIAARQNRSALAHLPGLESREPFFLASGRFVRRKNLHGLLLAYSWYRKRVEGQGSVPWRMVILGDGEERPVLEQLIIDEEIGGVTLPGFRQIDDLPAYYGLASVFIHPAVQEQWGLVVNEAMASALPVLVSERCGCVPDLVRNDETGFTFDPEKLQALAELMAKCGSGSVDLVAMGNAAQAHVAQWGLERFAQGMAQAVRLALE